MSTRTLNAMSMNETETQKGGEEAVEETTTETTEEGAEEATTEGEESAGSTTKEPLQIDYKAELEKLQKKIAGDAFRFRKEKRSDDKPSDEDDESDADRPLTMKEMQKILDEREAKILRTSTTKEALTFAKSLTVNEDEARYAASLWEHVTLPFDSMEEQMRFIIGGMNAERFIAQNTELQRSLQSKTMARKNTATTTRDALSSGAPKIDAQIKQALERTGFKFEPAKKAWVKTLANGKKMFNDGRGKKWFE